MARRKRAYRPSPYEKQYPEGHIPPTIGEHLARYLPEREPDPPERPTGPQRWAGRITSEINADRRPEPFDEHDLDALRRWLADIGSAWTLYEVVGYYVGACVVPSLYKPRHWFAPVAGTGTMPLPEFMDALQVIGAVKDPIPRMLEREPQAVVPFRSDREAVRQFALGCAIRRSAILVVGRAHATIPMDARNDVNAITRVGPR